MGRNKALARPTPPPPMAKGVPALARLPSQKIGNRCNLKATGLNAMTAFTPPVELDRVKLAIIQTLIASDITDEGQKARLKEAAANLRDRQPLCATPSPLVRIFFGCRDDYDLRLVKAAAKLFTSQSVEKDEEFGWADEESGWAVVYVSPKDEELAALTIGALVRLWRRQVKTSLDNQIEAFIYNRSLNLPHAQETAHG